MAIAWEGSQPGNQSTGRLIEPALSVFLAFLRAVDRPESHGRLTENNFGIVPGKTMSSGITRGIFEELIDSDLIKRINQPDPARAVRDGVFIYQLTPKGARLAHAMNGAASTDENEGVSNETWEPLPLEFKEPDLQEAIEIVQTTLDRVQGDNGLAAAMPEERRRVIWSLSAGLDALRQKIPSKNQVRELLLKPLNWLADIFGKGAIGELAKEAGKAVWRAVAGS